MPYTVEQAKAYVTEHREAMLQSLQDSTLPKFIKELPGMEHIWCSGCWLGNLLAAHGATSKQVHEIQFAHGQRCLGSDPYAVAARYLNEYLETEGIPEQPGIGLAIKIMAARRNKQKEP